MIIYPEHNIKELLDGIVLCLSRHSQATDAILSDIWGNLGYGGMRYGEQMKRLLLGDHTTSRKLAVKLGYDGGFNDLPVIYVTSGGDSLLTSSIGAIFDEDDDRYGRYSGKTHCIIMSQSIEEINMIFLTMRALMMKAVDTLIESGLELPKFSSSPVQPHTDSVPKNIYMKSIEVSYEYNVISGLAPMAPFAKIEEYIIVGTPYVDEN